MTSGIDDKGPCLTNQGIKGLIDELMIIRSKMFAEADRSLTLLADVHPNNQDSARNLLHYLVLRRRDLRSLQLRLAAQGLSSLGSSESYVLATVDAILDVLHRLIGQAWRPPPQETAIVDFITGDRLLAKQTEDLLGPSTPGRGVRIMVTMPSEAANDYGLVHSLLQQGMDCMRINCAHDAPAAWLRMIRHLRRAERSLGRTCKVVMDLTGPKLRTGPLDPDLAVVRIRPSHDIYGRVTAPARVWLTGESSCHPPPSSADAFLTMPDTWLSLLRPGEQLKFTDARNARRTLTVIEVSDHGCWTEMNRTAYVIPGSILFHEHGVAKGDDRAALVGELPSGENAIILRQGDQLILTRNLLPGRPATYDDSGQITSSAVIGCTIPEVFDDVLPGESIWFDDGKIGGIIEKVEKNQILVRITHARLRGEKLRGDKGINFPDSALRLTALTAKDMEDLRFVTRYADVIELSFANNARDVELLQEQLARLGNGSPAIVLKIETRRGFENLPAMLLAAMRASCCGVMIARGDLAVECGFERMAEVQEEILWICEAAHVPVIWATQVLENLAKLGMPSRAEITDAAMGHRAECVMINKGPHVLSAVRALDDILRRMQPHQSKKRAMLRALRLAHPLSTEADISDDCL